MTRDKNSDVVLYRRAKERIQGLLAGTGKHVLLVGIEDKYTNSTTHVVGAVQVPLVGKEESNCEGVELGLPEGTMLLNDCPLVR
jgi:hypothetical protein